MCEINFADMKNIAHAVHLNYWNENVNCKNNPHPIHHFPPLDFFVEEKLSASFFLSSFCIHSVSLFFRQITYIISQNKINQQKNHCFSKITQCSMHFWKLLKNQSNLTSQILHMLFSFHKKICIGFFPFFCKKNCIQKFLLDFLLEKQKISKISFWLKFSETNKPKIFPPNLSENCKFAQTFQYFSIQIDPKIALFCIMHIDFLINFLSKIFA